MKLTKKLLISFIGFSAIAGGATFAITSCSSHTNPWNSIKSGDPFTIHASDASDMINTAKTHIEQATTDASYADVFKNLPSEYGKDEVYWSIAYATAWYVKTTTHADIQVTFTSIATTSPYAVTCTINGTTITAQNPVATKDSTNHIYKMSLGTTDIGLAYILASFHPN